MQSSHVNKTGAGTAEAFLRESQQTHELWFGSELWRATPPATGLQGRFVFVALQTSNGTSLI